MAIPARTGPEGSDLPASGSIGDVVCATKTAMRALARQWLGQREERARLRDREQQLAARSNPALLELPGVGPDTSAALLITAGDNPARLRPSAAFAALAGVSPIEASGGKKSGHRGAAAATGWRTPGSTKASWSACLAATSPPWIPSPAEPPRACRARTGPGRRTCHPLPRLARNPRSSTNSS